jgi:hypothetical protein
MKRKGGGSYYLRGKVYWVKYYKDGRPCRESTGSSLERDARDLLNRRLGDIAAGRPLSPRADRIKAASCSMTSSRNIGSTSAPRCGV